MSDNEDDRPQLSAHTLAALKEFYQDREKQEQNYEEAKAGDLSKFKPVEDWQLSQFWYNDQTAETLAKEALAVVGDHGSIACLSSPTAYKKLKEIKPDTVTLKCLEFDRRFEVYGQDFLFYDYNHPLKFDEELKNSFDLVIADPPFLNDDCLTKTALSVKFLTKDKIILCTGSIMEELAKKLLGVSRCKFVPIHTNNLQNDFSCFVNYESKKLNE